MLSAMRVSHCTTEPPKGPAIDSSGTFKNRGKKGYLGGSVVKHLPSAQVMIPGSWDGAPRRAPCSAGSLLLPLPLPLLVFPLSCLSKYI